MQSFCPKHQNFAMKIRDEKIFSDGEYLHAKSKFNQLNNYEGTKCETIVYKQKMLAKNRGF